MVGMVLANGIWRPLNWRRGRMPRPDEFMHARDDYVPKEDAPEKFPDEFDVPLLAKFYVGDQKNLGACTGWGVGKARDYAMLAEGEGFACSKLMCYGNGRIKEGTFDKDSGCSVADVFDQSRVLGVCRDDYWPYIVDKFNVMWPKEAAANALLHKTTHGLAIRQALYDLQHCLYVYKLPVVFGSALTEAFEHIGPDGFYPMPSDSDQVIGGHCQLIVGWITYQGKIWFKISNSWSEDWGAGGFDFMVSDYLLGGGPDMPYATQWAGDFHCATYVKKSKPAPAKGIIEQADALSGGTLAAAA